MDPGGSQQDSADPVVFEEEDAFYDLLNLTSGDYVPLSKEELVQQSVFIGIGKVVDVQEGMEIRDLDALVSATTYTLVIQLAVDSTIKGEPDDGSVYIQYTHGGAFSVETYRANMPSGQALVFLHLPRWRETESVEYVNQDAGYPADATLYCLTTPQGWIIEGEESVRQPLESADPYAVFGTAATLAEIEAELTSDSQGPSTSREVVEPTPGPDDL